MTHVGLAVTVDVDVAARVELDASCFRRTCLLELAALAGVKPQVIDMIMWRVAHLSHTL